MEIKSIVLALGQVLAETPTEEPTESSTETATFIAQARAQNLADFTLILWGVSTVKCVPKKQLGILRDGNISKN